MNGSLKVVRGLILIALLSTMFSSCGGSQTTLSSNTTSGTTTGGGTNSGTTTTEEEEKNATIPAGYSASNIFVAVPDSIEFLTFTSLTGDPTKRCTFTSSSVVNDLTCNIEINELSLFFTDMKFQYNIPANKCKYINTEPYWFYNHEIGTGPEVVSMTITRDVSGAVSTALCQVKNNGVNSAVVPCDNVSGTASFNDVTFDLGDEAIPVCVYDASVTDGGMNCCLGKYDFYKKEIAGDGTQNVTIERGKSWGGSAGACIGGPGKTSWDKYGADGLPAGKIEKMKPNENRTKIYTIKNVSESVGGSPENYVNANYFTLGAHTHSGYSTASGKSSVFPYFVDPVSDRSGTLIRSGNPYYLFDCLDEAFETNFRIRVLVQDWDTVDALETYISTGTSAVGPDENGTAPANCPGLSGESCNNADDADDFVLRNGNIPGATYSTAIPTDRANYFPKSKY